MFSGRVDVVLEYRTVPAITNNPLSKRTMRVANSRFFVMCESAKWAIVFKFRYIYNRISRVAVNEDGLSQSP